MGPADKEEDGCKLWIGRTLAVPIRGTLRMVTS